MRGLAVPASKSSTSAGGRDGTGGGLDLANRLKNLDVFEAVEKLLSADVYRVHEVVQVPSPVLPAPARRPPSPGCIR